MARFRWVDIKELLNLLFWGGLVSFFLGGFIGVFGFGGAVVIATIFIAANIIVNLVEWLFKDEEPVHRE
jgi:hypothetical protein